MKPIIYSDEMDEMNFLNEYEKAYMRTGNNELVQMLTKRAKMFQSLHRAWIEYNAKAGTFKRLTKEEWKARAANILQLQFHFKKEQHKGILDQYFTKVDYPIGGLAK